tara:strand:- start:694 stop:891 length:198 start_codon:yes stop_codon:yes gene_type:complete
MFDVYLLTIWLELNGKLSMYRTTPTMSCEGTVKDLAYKYKDRPEKLIAVKCDTLETIKEKKEYFK